MIEDIDSIENMRRNTISEIREKIKKDHKCLHPCNKERLEYQKKLKFENGYEFIRWLQQSGIMKNSTDVENNKLEKFYKKRGFKNNKDYRDYIARRKGYKDNADYMREWCYNHGICGPSSENENCSLYLGIIIGENVAEPILTEIWIKEKMPSKNPGYEYIVNGEYKIDVKTTTLKLDRRNGNYIWPFHIDYNDITDYFLLLALDDIESKNLIHVWLIHKYDMVTKGIGKGYVIEKFYIRDKITMRNDPKYLSEFEKYDLIDKLKCINTIIDILKSIE